MLKTKTYSEMSKLSTYEERLEYLFIGDKIANETFGPARWLNQRLYTCIEWRRIRDRIIIRDNGCDLGIDGCDLGSKNIIVHHINPITKEDILQKRPIVFDEDNLICVSLQTHNFIHYGIKTEELPIDRSPNDTCPWKK